ncbi:MAG: hypothetical protein K6E92_00665 [Lachnospiraceae bacterium]|nr:hypothetical protein [Lachnospiraceae bacterium]
MNTSKPIPPLEEAVLGVRREDYPDEVSYETECRLRRLETHGTHKLEIVTDSHIPFGKAVKTFVSKVVKSPMEAMSNAQNAYNLETANAIRALNERIEHQQALLEAQQRELESLKKRLP